MAGAAGRPAHVPPSAGVDRMIADLVRSRDTPDEVVEAARLP
jgi:hypothetical protein